MAQGPLPTWSTELEAEVKRLVLTRLKLEEAGYRLRKASATGGPSDLPSTSSAATAADANTTAAAAAAVSTAADLTAGGYSPAAAAADTAAAVAELG